MPSDNEYLEAITVQLASVLILLERLVLHVVPGTPWTTDKLAKNSRVPPERPGAADQVNDGEPSLTEYPNGEVQEPAGIPADPGRSEELPESAGEPPPETQ